MGELWQAPQAAEPYVLGSHPCSASYGQASEGTGKGAHRRGPVVGGHSWVPYSDEKTKASRWLVNQEGQHWEGSWAL